MSIKNHNQVGDCDLCGACGVNIKDLDEFEDFFIELLCLFNKDDNGEDIGSVSLSVSEASSLKPVDLR